MPFTLRAMRGWRHFISTAIGGMLEPRYHFGWGGRNIEVGDMRIGPGHCDDVVGVSGGGCCERQRWAGDPREHIRAASFEERNCIAESIVYRRELETGD